MKLKVDNESDLVLYNNKGKPLIAEFIFAAFNKTLTITELGKNKLNILKR